MYHPEKQHQEEFFAQNKYHNNNESNNNSKKMNVVKTMFIENRIWVIYEEIQRRKSSFDHKKLLLFISFSL